MSDRTHEYASRLTWTGNLGTGTSTYKAYGRDYTVAIDGKPDLHGSADAMFLGNGGLHNPEDLFIASISSCHLLSYLALCAWHKVQVTGYEDRATGILVLTPDGGGFFEQVTLNLVVTITDTSQEALAVSLHDKAHKQCFIASSCSVPIHHNVVVKIAAYPES